MWQSIKDVCNTLAYNPDLDPHKIPGFLDLGPLGKFDYEVHKITGDKAERVLPSDPKRTTYFVPVSPAPDSPNPAHRRIKGMLNTFCVVAAGIAAGLAVAAGSYVGSALFGFVIGGLLCVSWSQFSERNFAVERKLELPKKHVRFAPHLN